MRQTESGFTLIEVLIALVLFSMIGIAGFSMLNAILGVQSRTERRLDRLAELQRAMHVLVLDFQQQLADRPISVEGPAAVVARAAGGPPGAILVVTYDLDGGNLRRRLALPGAVGAPAGEDAGRSQILLSGVEALRWEFYGARTGWVATWPKAGPGADEGPEAIAAELTIGAEDGGLSGRLRRIVRLPARPAP